MSKTIHKKITKNVSITILEDENKVYLDLKKHVPIVIHATDKYRKGIMIDICAGCDCLKTITLYDSDNKRYCEECTSEMLDKEKQLQATKEVLKGVEDSLEALRIKVQPRSQERFELLSEAYVEQIKKLKAEIKGVTR